MSAVKTRKAISGLLMCFLILVMITPSALAAMRHENPDKAGQTFTGTALFRFYADTLDSALLKKPQEVEARLTRMQFANLPQSIGDSTSKFAVSGIELSYLTVEIDKNISKMRTLLGEYRLSEIRELSTKIASDLSMSDGLVENLKRATEVMGKEFVVHSAASNTELRGAFDDVLKKVGGLNEITVSNGKELSILQKVLSELEKLLLPAEVTLNIASSAFVGDTVSFEGRLTSRDKPLSGREVSILVNGATAVTAVTGDDGYYRGSLEVPYLYVREIDVQASYVTKGKDIGLYMSPESPIIKLKVLFYFAAFEIADTGKTFPGLEKEIHGRFDYGQNPVLPARRVEIYLDDVLVGDETVGVDFSTKIMINPDISLGKHKLTVSAINQGRYSQTVAFPILDVTRAVPTLDIDLPAVALMPGSMALKGKLWSDVGQLKGASVNIVMGDSQVLLVTEKDGSFQGEIGIKMALDLIGIRNLRIRVSPQEPWNAPLFTTKNVVTVNMVDSGILLLLIIIFLIVFRRELIPRRSKRVRTSYTQERMKPEAAIVPARPVLAYNDSQYSERSESSHKETAGNARETIFYLYELLVKLIERVARSFMRPHHTLREFAHENSRILGPLSTYFLELTKFVERMRYSRYIPNEGDLLNFKQLSNNIETGLKNRNG